MNTTVAGVFKTAGEARQAWCRLAAAGVSNTAIRLAVEDWPWVEAAPAEHGPTPHARGAVKRFFVALLQRVSEAASDWTRPQTSDHFVLTIVIADPQQVEPMETILDECGAVDIDEQADEQASAYDMPLSLGDRGLRVEPRVSSVGPARRNR